MSEPCSSCTHAMRHPVYTCTVSVHAHNQCIYAQSAKWSTLSGYMQMATVLLYLSAPEEGGETVFPLEGEHGLDRLPTIDYTSCNQGLKVAFIYQGPACVCHCHWPHFQLQVTLSEMLLPDDCPAMHLSSLYHPFCEQALCQCWSPCQHIGLA